MAGGYTFCILHFLRVQWFSTSTKTKKLKTLRWSTACEALVERRCKREVPGWKRQFPRMLGCWQKTRVLRVKEVLRAWMFGGDSNEQALWAIGWCRWDYNYIYRMVGTCWDERDLRRIQNEENVNPHAWINSQTCMVFTGFDRPWAQPEVWQIVPWSTWQSPSPLTHLKLKLFR